MQRPAPTPTHERKLSISYEPKTLSGQEFEKALREALEALQLNNEEQAKIKISAGRKPRGSAATDVKPRPTKRKHKEDDGDYDDDNDNKDRARGH